MPLNLPYYYGHSGEQYAFFRIPKLLLTDDRFAEISTDAKLLYGLLLDRMELSYRTADCQLGFALSGFGCTPGARGRAVYFEELYSGERCRWDASDILGVANPEKIPDWAKEKLREYEQKRTEPKKERGEAR